MVVQQKMSVEHFDEWVRDQADDYEYIAGETTAVVSNNYCSLVAGKVLIYIGMYLLQNDIGYVTGADGGYMVNGERYIPDVGYISKGRQANPNPPELAVEVVSPTDDPRKISVKMSNYLAEGVEVWIVYPEEKEVHIHKPGQGATIIDSDGTLTADLLPGFKLAVKDIFPQEEDASS